MATTIIPAVEFAIGRLNQSEASTSTLALIRQSGPGSLNSTTQTIKAVVTVPDSYTQEFTGPLSNLTDGNRLCYATLTAQAPVALVFVDAPAPRQPLADGDNITVTVTVVQGGAAGPATDVTGTVDLYDQ